MDDSAFDSLLEDIVITSPQPDGEYRQPVEYLQTWLEKLKMEYGDLLKETSFL